MKTVAIIVAAGEGMRMGQSKQFIEILGKPILSWTISVFEESEFIDDIILVVNFSDIERAKSFKFKKIINVVEGGREREDSVYNGLKVVGGDVDVVLIHDGARPLLTKNIIASAISEVKVSPAVVVGVPIIDTVKKIGDENFIISTEDREALWLAQTPQVFKYKLIKEAYDRAYKVGYKATDDSTLVERLGYKAKIIMGSYENIKITFPEDLIIAEAILERRLEL